METVVEPFAVPPKLSVTDTVQVTVSPTLSEPPYVELFPPSGASISGPVVPYALRFSGIDIRCGIRTCNGAVDVKGRW